MTRGLDSLKPHARSRSRLRISLFVAWTRATLPEMKRQAQHEQLWNNASGAILHPDTCICSTLLLNHLQGLCPGAQTSGLCTPCYCTCGVVDCSNLHCAKKGLCVQRMTCWWRRALVARFIPGPQGTESEAISPHTIACCNDPSLFSFVHLSLVFFFFFFYSHLHLDK